jgi:hypothetical protein
LRGKAGLAPKSGINLDDVLILICDSSLTSPIVTFTVGKEGRLFAAHEDVLTLSPYFATVLKGQLLDAQSKRISLPDEEPEIFSCVLEYLYVCLLFPTPASPSILTRLIEGRLLPPFDSQQT